MRLQELLGNEDYLGAVAVTEELCALAPPRLERATGAEKSAATFEFCMEELYRMLFQEEASLERRRQLNALYKECRRYLRRTQPNSLSKEFGRLKQPTSFGMRQVLWKYAAIAWLHGWLAAGTSTQNAAESEHKEKEAANIIPLPKETVKDEEHTDYRFS